MRPSSVPVPRCSAPSGDERDELADVARAAVVHAVELGEQAPDRIVAAEAGGMHARPAAEAGGLDARVLADRPDAGSTRAAVVAPSPRAFS